MLNLLAISNYRSLSNLIVPLGALNLITGPNGSGKSNVYRALRLLADTANGGVVGSLAREGGISSTLWAGPATQRKEPVALRRAATNRNVYAGLGARRSGLGGGDANDSRDRRWARLGPSHFRCVSGYRIRHGRRR